jgi:hypothetical protein
MKFLSVLLILILGCEPVWAQGSKTQSSSLHFIYGQSGANIRDFNEMLARKGISPLRKGYNSYGMAYQSRFNDFIFGIELIHNNGPTSDFRGYEIDYRSSRLYSSIGYSFTESDQRIQLIHYMSLGVGYLNFEMIRGMGNKTFPEFLNSPGHGFIIKQNDIHKGSWNLGGFLTEIGFQLGYDFPLPGAEESMELVSKFGYSFSPFENAWNNKGMAFDNIQSGAFLRVGVGITLQDQNYFYRDATLGIHFFYGKHLSRPNQLNNYLVAAGLNPLAELPNNLGIKIIGENRGRLYGFDFFNISQFGKANEQYDHTLNSVRIYGNVGHKLYEGKKLEFGFLGGIGYANVRYTLENLNKPNFPALFEEPDFDGYISDGGFVTKPEIFLAYVMPISRQHIFDMVYSFHTGYELPLNKYFLADLDITPYMAGPYIQFSVGIRP